MNPRNQGKENKEGNMKYEKEFRQMLDKWGEDSQIMMCIEEMAELQKELCKYLRIKANPDTVSAEKAQNLRQEIQAEIADVLNTVKQLALIFGYDEIYKIRDEKISKTMSKFF